MPRGDDNAFPPALPREELFAITDGYGIGHGLTKREYIATRALQTLLSVDSLVSMQDRDPRFTGENISDVAALNAVEFADALLRALNQEQSNVPG